MRILQAFLARIRPASTMANPACMKNTRNAARHVQRTLTSSSRLSTAYASSAATSGVAARINQANSDMRFMSC